MDRVRRTTPFSLGGQEGYRYQYATNETELRFHTTGLGDRMMVRQLGRAFHSYLRRNGDPAVGEIAITSGGLSPRWADHEEGDVDVYWWYSFGPMDDEPGQFHDEFLAEHMTVDIDLVLCGSKRIEREARQLGYETLYFPIGVHGFEPLDTQRAGLGYAGTKGHKRDDKEEMVLGPFADRPDFEWVTRFTEPEELNFWYNTRLLTFGLTKEGQRQWGVVNSRVFEALGSGTPLVIPDHPTLDDVLGFEYPYQVADRAEVTDLVEEMTARPSDTLAEFREYAHRIRDRHDYTRRLETLFDSLQ